MRKGRSQNSERDIRRYLLGFPVLRGGMAWGCAVYGQSLCSKALQPVSEPALAHRHIVAGDLGHTFFHFLQLFPHLDNEDINLSPSMMPESEMLVWQLNTINSGSYF